MTYGVFDCFVKVTRGVYIRGTPYADDVIVQVAGEERDLLIGSNYGATATQEEFDLQEEE